MIAIFSLFQIKNFWIIYIRAKKIVKRQESRNKQSQTGYSCLCMWQRYKLMVDFQYLVGFKKKTQREAGK